jgi:histidinol-phosphate aminotransferase
MAFCDDKHPAIFADITYGFYSVFAELNRVPYIIKPLRDDFTIDIDDYCGNCGTVFIANPNAPTGILLTLDEIEKIVRSNPDYVVVIDEAYIDFGGESALKLLDSYKNLLVVRTYSKSRSLAGARLGFAFADKEIIADLNKLKFSTNPYSINRLTLIAGEAALRNGKYYDDNAQKIIETRQYVTKKLREMGFEVIESAANFVLAGHDDISGSLFAEEMKKRGILIRHFSGGRLEKYNRITIGTQAEMDAFLFATEKIIKGAAL